MYILCFYPAALTYLSLPCELELLQAGQRSLNCSQSQTNTKQAYLPVWMLQRESHAGLGNRRATWPEHLWNRILTFWRVAGWGLGRHVAGLSVNQRSLCCFVSGSGGGGGVMVAAVLIAPSDLKYKIISRDREQRLQYVLKWNASLISWRCVLSSALSRK